MLVGSMTEAASFLVDPGDVPGLRDAVGRLSGVGYAENSIRERLLLEDLTDLQWRALPIYRAERLTGRDPLDVAIDLFLLQGVVAEDELGRVLTAFDRDVLVRAGVLAIDEAGMTRARASLFPVGDRLIFSDHAWPELPHPGVAAVPYDQVMWIGLDSRHLARCTSRRPFRAALDLCTGSGIHALLASAHAGRMLAVDINPRAAACTRLNALASGIGNVEVAVGDLYETVVEEKFDLITANPPFVPSPLDSLRFRDGGGSGEDVLKRIVAGLPGHLAPGGMAQIITELGERENEPLVDRLREWLDGAAMDIHILRLSEHTATKYAIGHAKGDDYRVFLDSVDAWATNLREQGYARVVSVVLSFAWSDGTPWDRVDQSPAPRRGAGGEIDATFLAERLARHADCSRKLKNAWLCRAGAIALLEARVLGSGLRAKTKATLLGQALTVEHHLEPVEREMLERMEGRVAVPELFAGLRDIGVDESAAIGAARELLRRGLVRMSAGG